MKLKEYLKLQKYPITRFAEAIGISITTFHNILRGHKDIRLSTAMRIVKATQGIVSFEELAEDIKVIKTYEAQRRQPKRRKKQSVSE